jgi:hypothetical protein
MAASASPTPSVNNGTVTGYVQDSGTGRPIDLAIVTLTSATGGCTGPRCPNGTTNYRGYFVISAAPGLYTLTATATNYSENETSVTVLAGTVTPVGTIGLEKDGVVIGTLEGDDATHEALVGFGVSVTSRNSALGGGSVVTDAKGQFRVSAPPVADRVDFSTPASAGAWPYASNFTFVFPGPGATVDLGVVEMVRATELNVTLLDRATHRPIGPDAPTRLFTCEQRTGACPIPGPAGGANSGDGPNETAWAVPGPTILHVLVVGYVVNVTPVGNIPAETPRTAVRVSVNLTPMGAVEVNATVTGGDPSAGGPRLSGVWKYVDPNTNVSGAVVCSLDGITVAVATPGGLVPDPCFPNILGYIGRNSTFYGPPLRDWVGIGDFASAVPMFENMTWVNLTPDRLTDAGPLNLTPGGYITGEVYLQGTTQAPSLFSVQACSTNEQGICGPVASYSGDATHPSPNASLMGCHTDAASFCVAAPPGPVVLNVLGAGAVAGASNTTWAFVPLHCCSASPRALSLWNATDPHVASVNLSAGAGSVSGRVVGDAGAIAPPLGYAEVEACLVSVTSNPPCGQSVTSNGTFAMTAPLGWDEVTALASGFRTNETWVDVTGANSTGTIRLSPLALLTGRVVAPNGTGVLGAVVEYCPIAPAVVSQPGCTPVGSGATGSGGYFAGSVPGGEFPSSTYEVQATASGFSGNWTWVNATPGALVPVPTIVLAPTGNGSGPGALALGPRIASGTLTTWVEGRVVDAATLGGLSGASLNACSIATPPTCVPFTDSTSTGGEFNASLVLGDYELSVGVAGYVPATLFVNATGLATVDLGAIGLTPYPWVEGRVAIGPWKNLTLVDGLGPDPAGVVVCTSGRTTCGPTGLLNTGGFFNVSGPVGASDGLYVNASGGSPNDGYTTAAAQGGGAPGFVSVSLGVDVTATGASVGLGGASVPTLTLFGSLYGTLYDGSTYNASRHAPGARVAWGTVVVSGPDPGADLRLYASGGGQYTAFVPGGESVTVVGSGSAYLRVSASSVAVPAAPGSIGVGALELPHHGWVTGRVVSALDAVVPFATVSASVPDPANGTTIASNGTADADGYFNLSAPSGATVTVRATGPGYGAATTVADVRPSRTTVVAIPGLRSAVTEFLVRSAAVNSVHGRTNATVVDAVTGRPVPGVSVSVTNGFGNVIDLPTVTNGNGQFLLASSVEPLETLGFVENGYTTNSSAVPSPTPSVITVAVENMTGDGVVAGRIVGLPTGLGVGGANVSACPVKGAAICTTVETNGGGDFWLARPPGAYTVSVSAPLFDTNISLGVTVCSDCFLSVGDVGLYADAIVSGTIVGGPALHPIEGANVTLCPTNGTFFLPCAIPTITDAFGSFQIVAPLGSYVFRAVAPLYGPASFPVDLSVGELVGMGLVALPSDGGLNGTVVAATTGAGLANATVLACIGNTSECESAGPTGPSGEFELGNLTPGAVSVTASASNYTTGYATVEVPAGRALALPPLRLWPLGVTPRYPLSGVVEWNATGAPVAGAHVSAYLVDGGLSASAVTGSNGTFRFGLAVGAYEVVVTLPGARAVRIAASVVSGPISNVSVRLDPSTYELHGTVTGSGPGVPVPGALVRLGPNESVLTGSDGAYAFLLPNGSYHVTAEPSTGASTYEFAGTSGSATVAGGPAVLNLLLPERTQPIALTVLDASTGRALVGASVSFQGVDVFGVAHSALLATAADGSADAAFPVGAYALWANASGYVPGAHRSSSRASGCVSPSA